MRQTGVWNEACGVEAFGLEGLAGVSWNFGEAVLIERAVRRGEAQLSASGALVAEARGGDAGLVIVRDEASEAVVPWATREALTRDLFETLFADMQAHATGRELFAQDLYAGDDRRLPLRIFAEQAWRAMYARTAFAQPGAEELESFMPDFTILDLPTFRPDAERHGVEGDAIVAIDLSRRVALIGGPSSAAVIAEAAAAALEHLKPAGDSLALRGAVGLTRDGVAALFIGPAGSGKSTLAAAGERTIAADGPLGWSQASLFGVSGGRTGDTAALSSAEEADALAAANHFGAVLENVPLDPQTREPELPTASGRFAVPVSGEAERGVARPAHLFVIANDSVGVLPALARLTPEKTVELVLAGYSPDLVDAEPRMMFTPAFGEVPAADLAAYGDRLGRLIVESGARCWLLNTGWVGPAAAGGRRVPVEASEALVAHVLDGSFDQATFGRTDVTDLAVPAACPGVEPELLRPQSLWEDGEAYRAAARAFVEGVEAAIAPSSLHSAPDAAFDGARFREAAE